MANSNSLSTGEIAKYCDVNLRTVIRWIERGVLKGYKLPGRGNNRVRKEDFVAFLNTNKMPVPEEFKPATDQPVVLFVDDELDMLKSIKRILRKTDIQLFLADSAEKGLALLKEHNADLVMSDMKMPGMSGAEFLEEVAIRYPDTYRVILTGYSDMDSTISAINKGRIHRYIQKPWDNDELISSIETGLEKVRLKRDNLRLQSVINKQNTLLKKLNQNLEEKVDLRTQQIRLALRKIEKNHEATQQLLFNFISINPDLSGSFANSVSQLSRRLARLLALPQEEIDQVSYASLLCEIGLLGLPSELRNKPFAELNHVQQAEYLRQTQAVQTILGPAVHLQPIIDILTCQFEHFNGKGSPNKLQQEQIPMGARILAVARDFWRYSQGRITNDKLDDIAVRRQLKNYAGTRYDPVVVGLLVDNKDILSDEHMEKPISAASIKPGMTLKYNLMNESHILILPEGHEFTEETIDKLQTYERSRKSPLKIVVNEN